MKNLPDPPKTIWILAGHACRPPENYWYRSEFWCGYCGQPALRYVLLAKPRARKKVKK